MVIGENGIIKKAKDAAEATEQAAIREQEEMNSLYEELVGNINGGGKEEQIGKVGVGEKAEKKSTINGEEASGVNPIIPAGYIAINTSTTSWGDGTSGPGVESVSKGLVITDSVDGNGNSNGNEWVWVPVPDASVMYETASTPIVLTGGLKDNGEGFLDLRINNNPVTVSKYSKSITITNNDNQTVTIGRVLPNDTSSYREPDVVVGSSGTSYDAEESYRATAGFKKADGTTMTVAEMADTMRREYETMIRSIEKYKGFYIGRYELTANGEKPGATLTNKNWYYLYGQCKGLAASEKVMTRMIWGSQWDVTCSYIANYGDRKDIKDSSTWGNYSDYNAVNGFTEVEVVGSDGGTKYEQEKNEKYVEGAGSKTSTGYSEYWKANNIYDFAGNCWEWTQEADNTNDRALRGGSYNYYGSGRPASSRGYDYPAYDVYSDLRFSSHFNSATLIKGERVGIRRHKRMT